MVRHRLPLLLAALLVAATASACQDDPPSSPEDGIREYVALGDSYVAAPHLPDDDLSMPCSRSEDNYPSFVADGLMPIHLTDVSCVGAVTAHLTGEKESPDGTSVPAQLDALSEDTDLVTITVGGNDKGLFQSWLSCYQLKSVDPKGSPCADSYRTPKGNALLRRIPEIQDNVSGVLDEVERRAPNAVVVVATYPQVFPDKGTCKLASAYATGDLAYINTIVKTLSDALIAAAREAGVAWVDVYAASHGHDVCAKQPWVNGTSDDETRARVLHPFPEEQAAVAQLILGKLIT